MKNAFIVLAMLVSFSSAFAASFVGTTVSPFVTASRLIQTGSATLLSPFATTLASAQARGVAGQEQMRDDLAALNDDMISGAVKSIDEVRQPALKELFAEIAASEEQMSQINAAIPEGSELHRIASAVTAVLLME